MKKRYKILIFLFLVFVVWLCYANNEQYEYPDNQDIAKRVSYLERVLRTPLEQNYDLIQIGNQNPEWELFTLSFSTYAFTNIALHDPSFKPKAIELIDLAIQKAKNEKTFRPYFDTQNPFQSGYYKQGSVLYLGHLNLMLGCHRLLNNNSTHIPLHDSISNSLFNRYQNNAFPALASYNNLIWIPDNTVALSSLKLHSQITGSQYITTCRLWKEYAQKHWIDEKTGLLYSTINSRSGKGEEQPRGSMIGWSIFFINQFDEAFAKSLYENYKEKFSTNLLAWRLYKERENDNKTSYGDIDSGPIFKGYSIPANAFAFADAVALKDFQNAKQLQRLIKFGSKKISQKNETKYETRFVDLTVSPLAEALLLYFETIRSWE